MSERESPPASIYLSCARCGRALKAGLRAGEVQAVTKRAPRATLIPLQVCLTVEPCECGAERKTAAAEAADKCMSEVNAIRSECLARSISKVGFP